MEQSFGGPLGTLWAGLGMGAYYVGLTWIDILLGFFLTPLFLIPLTWIRTSWLARRRPIETAPDWARKHGAMPSGVAPVPLVAPPTVRSPP